MPRRFRINQPHFAFLHDAIMAAASFVLSLYLRLGDAFFSERTWSFLPEGTVLFTAVAALVFLFTGLYRGVWRYASINDLVAITRAVTIAILIFLPAMFLLTRLEAFPRSVLVINWLVLIGLLGGPRLLYRIIKDRRVDVLLARDGRERIPVLLVGAGDAAEVFIREMNRSPGANYRVVGLVDRHGRRVGRHIHGVPVLGDIGALPAVVRRLSQRGERPRRLIITDQTIDGAEVRALLDVADSLGIPLARTPRLTDFKSGAADRLEIAPIALEDLLGRPQTVLDREGMARLIAGRRVLVTGAGGTIGSELVRQVSAFGPARMDLVDLSESQLYEIDLELSERHPGLTRKAILADIRDREQMQELIQREAPELVFHAAALKHVPVVEAHPDEGVLTNVVGTRNVADACRRAGVDAMVLISTDKAVNPTSVMGATKRMAESYCQALDLMERGRGGGTRFITVRFGNVLGSTGSVVPLFRRQLEAGGPLTVTHPDVTRYFMTTREAVELVLQASVLGCGPDSGGGKIYVLEMGEPVRIVDLARQMIRLAGLRPEADVGIEFIGLRPGEKLHEELFHDAEHLGPTPHESIRLAAPRTADHALLSRAMDELAENARTRRHEQTLSLLRRLVPEYRPDGDRDRLAAAAR